MMKKALLLYPEFPNTFFLTYHILSDPKREYGGFKWDIEQCDWNWINTKERVNAELNGRSYDVICYYGTNQDTTFIRPSGYNYKFISLPAYQPRFIFIPYDFDIYKNVYEELKLNANGIITANDIGNYPDWKNSGIKSLLKERGIQENVFSDTKDQAFYIRERLVESCELNSSKTIDRDQQFRLYYYGAPLTIFYLNHFPNYLPIRINYAAIHEDNRKFNKHFKTFIHIYYKSDCVVLDLEKSIRNDVFCAYVDAILEPQLLTPIFRKFKEMVPRGQFYTMRDINDFARAITLHCNPDINGLFEEINTPPMMPYPRDKNSSCDYLKDRQIKILHDFRERTSESTRNSDKDRVSDLAKVKKIAFGCKIFLSVYLYENKYKNSYFESMSSSDNVFINRMFKGNAAFFLYNFVVTCLAWEYVLSIFKCNHNDVSGTVLPMRCTGTYGKSSKTEKLFFLRYKRIENEVIELIYKICPRVEEDGKEYNRNDIKKFIAFTEYIINKYVQESIQNKSIEDKKEAYNYFSNLVYKSQRDKRNKILLILLKKIIDYKCYRYIK